MSIEEEAEAAAQADSDEQSGSLGSQPAAQPGESATSPFATRFQGLVKNFSMILNFKAEGKGS